MCCCNLVCKRMEASPISSLARYANLPDLLDRVDNDHEFLREILVLFRTEFPRLRFKLQEAVPGQDMQQTAGIAHLLKGMLANLSLERAAAAAGALEAMAAAQNRPGTEHALAVFDNEVVDLLPVLDAYLAETKAVTTPVERPELVDSSGSVKSSGSVDS
jgi:HPt (histidine-containing phosphotransfer) domain-containing protein